MLKQKSDLSRFDFDVRYTKCKGHASELAKEAVDKRYDYVLAVGGDGTVNEIAANLVHTDTALSIIPLGSGNGLARHLGISTQASKALDVFFDENVVNIDYCKANDIFFFCTFGMGLDAKVSEAFSKRKTRGLHTYLTGALTEYAKVKSETYIITPENEESFSQKAFMITCANASQWGYNARIAPAADIRDGLMDVVILLPFPVYDAAPLGLQLFTKHFDKSSFVKIIKTKQLVIEREKEGIAHVDGEPVFMGKKVDVRIFGGGLRVVVPREK